MSRPIPGQRGLPQVAPDVPKFDLDEAFGIGPPEEPTPVILALVFEGVRWSEVEKRLAQLAYDLGASVAIVYVDRKEG